MLAVTADLGHLDPVKFCIHRGSQEIGGTCVEIESQGKRIVLDIGLPLDEPDADAMPLHPVPGFDKPDPSLLGVVISHPHQDHYGLAHRLPPETPFLIGAAAQRILEAACFFTPAGLMMQNVRHLEDRKPVTLGPFTITPYLVDHSAYDSYAILVEADGKRLFYSGDFRAHGRKARLVERLIADPPKDVDVLLMEGTTLGRPESEHGFPTEDDLVPRFVELFEQTEGLALVWASGQNIDRLVTLYKACRKAKRQLILDVYTASVLQAIGNDNLPQPGWQGIRVFLPGSQRSRIVRENAFDRIDCLKPYRIYPNQLSPAAGKSVMLFRPSLMFDLTRIGGLKNGGLIMSVWPGYLTDQRQKPMLDWLKANNIPISHCHTSGHATRADLKRLAHTLSGARSVLIHSDRPDLATTLFQRANRVCDGAWESV